MKGSIFAVVAVASGLVSAQFPGVPDCAAPCLVAAISSAGCALTDVGCQCSSTAAIQGAGSGCILGACTKSGEIQQAISAGLGLCTAYLATVSATATDSEELTTTLLSTSTETSTVTVQTTDIPSPTPSSNSTSTITSAPILGTGGVTSTRSSAPVGTATQVPVGAGSKVAVGLGGVGALFMAFFAL